jgi:membrane protease YdiL (CAAX protease family)
VAAANRPYLRTPHPERKDWSMSGPSVELPKCKLPLTRLTQMAANHTLVFFFVIAFAFSWLVFLPMILFHAPIELTALASFGPTVAALGAHRLASGNYRAFRIYTTWPRIVGASALGVALIVFAYVVLPGVTTADPHKLNWSILASVAVYNYSTLLGGPLGEEPGWRGYALPRLEERYGPVSATLLLALLWAAWHLPLFLIPDWTTSPLWTFVLILVGVSIIMTTAVNLARFSVIAAIATHAAFNTVSRFLNGLFIHTQPSVRIPFELVLALCGIATALVLIGMTKGRLAYRGHRNLI